MRKPTFSWIRPAGRFLLDFVVTTATATLNQVRCLAAWVAEYARLSRYKWAVGRQRQRLGRELRARQSGDEDLRRQITSLEEHMRDPATSRLRRWLLRRPYDALLRRLADSTLLLAEPPPGVGSAYRDFRRSLVTVSASSRRLAAARTILWPRERREWLHLGLGTAALASVVVGLALALMPSSSRSDGPPPPSGYELTRDQNPVDRSKELEGQPLPVVSAGPRDGEEPRVEAPPVAPPPEPAIVHPDP